MSVWTAAFIGGMVGGFIVGIWHGRRYDWMVDSYQHSLQEVIAERDELADALHSIVAWADAYPLDIFPEPDLDIARQLLEAGGMTLDAVSASAMRHCLQGVRKIAAEALEP